MPSQVLEFGAEYAAALYRLRQSSYWVGMVPNPLKSSRPFVLDFAASRGLPISAGWNSTAAPNVHISDKASSLPILDVPGCFDNQRLPNAVAVVSALQMTARVRLDCNGFACPARQAMM